MSYLYIQVLARIPSMAAGLLRMHIDGDRKAIVIAAISESFIKGFFQTSSENALTAEQTHWISDGRLVDQIAQYCDRRVPGYGANWIRQRLNRLHDRLHCDQSF